MLSDDDFERLRQRFAQQFGGPVPSQVALCKMFPGFSQIPPILFETEQRVIHKPTDYPKTWEEFQERCRERIRKVRESGDQGHFANTYVEDVEMLLTVMHESHQDYDGNPRSAYAFIMRQLEKPETECTGRPGKQAK